MSKYHHAPKQVWQTRVLIQCWYGLSGVILFIFLIILNIWVYYTITFCRFTFCFYILMAKQTNRRKRPVFNETHLQKIFFENWRTTKLYGKKERTSEQCHEFIKKLKEAYTKGQNCFNDIIYKVALCNRSFMHYNKATHKLCFLAKSTESYRVGSHKIERIM